jgi:hypothetical protein
MVSEASSGSRVQVTGNMVGHLTAQRHYIDPQTLEYDPRYGRPQRLGLSPFHRRSLVREPPPEWGGGGP